MQKWSDYPEDAHRARARLYARIKAGTIARGPCSVCGRQDRVWAHWNTFNDDSTLRWLCRAHHYEVVASANRKHRISLVNQKRMELGLSIRELASASGVTASAIATRFQDNAEASRDKGALIKWYRVAQALGLSLDDIARDCLEE